MQALQLLHGGRNPAVRSPSTLVALDGLLAAGLVSDREHRDLSRAYRFLRRVEHRVQLAEGQQTHRLSDDPDVRGRIARRIGNDLDTFEERLQRHRGHVRSIAATITQPDEQPAAVAQRERDQATRPRPGRTGRHPAAMRSVPSECATLRRRTRSCSTWGPAPTARSRRGAPRATARENLLLACLDSADPDGALARLVEFAALRPAHYGVWRVLAEGSGPGRDLVGLTAELFGTSDALSRGLIGFPVAGGHLHDESIGMLLDAGTEALPDTFEFTDDPPDPRGVQAALLKFKHRHVCAIALHDLGHRPDALEVGAALSDVAEVIVRELLVDVAAETARERPAAAGLRMAVFALGKFGMQAMDYGSDLDLLFVFDSDGDTPVPQPEAIRLGQRLISRLSDRTHGSRLYEIDMRLRPSGRQGLLVSPLPGFNRYHARPLPVWERLSLVRLRPVAEVVVRGGGSGHGAGPARRCGGRDRAPHPRPAVHAAGDRERRRRSPSAASRASSRARTAKPATSTSRRGSAVASSSSCSRPRWPWPTDGSIRISAFATSVTALERLGDAGVLAADEARALCAAYRFERLLLNRLRMAHGGGIDDPDRFAQNSPRLRTLARRMGLPSRQSLLDQYRHASDVVRGAFERHLSNAARIYGHGPGDK